MTSRGSGRSRLGVVALCVVCLVLFVWPVAMLAYGTLRTAPPGQGGRWSTSGLTSALTSWDVWHSFINSLILSAATVALSTALAIYLAWLVTRTRTPLRQIVTPVAVLIFAVPPMFYTLSWAMLGQQPGGLIDKALQGMFGATPVNVQSWYGLIIVSVLGATAAQYLLLLGPFRALNPALEEASLVCGASRLRSVFQIEIPALGPAILGVMILGFVLGMGLLTTPLLLGEPAGIYVLPTEIYRLIEGETPADYAGASTLSLLLVLVVLALVAIQSKLLGQRKFVTVTGKSSRREAIDIGPWKWPGLHHDDHRRGRGGIRGHPARGPDHPDGAAVAVPAAPAAGHLRLAALGRARHHAEPGDHLGLPVGARAQVALRHAVDRAPRPHCRHHADRQPRGGRLDRPGRARA